MNIIDGKDTFTALFPDMMKATRLLIIDHDICRYHSFDLLRYQLYRDTLDRSGVGQKHFMSIKPEYQTLLNAKIELAYLAQYAQHNVSQFNVYDCFGFDLGINSVDRYAIKVHDMLKDPAAKITPTDVNNRFEIVFDRKNITGYILQYANDPNHPTYMDKLTAYTDPNPLDLDAAIDIIQKHQINAVMICSAELAVRLATKLYEAAYTKAITFIIGRYAYNFHNENGRAVYPLFNHEMSILEAKLKHEFGYFDPFSGLTYRSRYIEEMQQGGITGNDDSE